MVFTPSLNAAFIDVCERVPVMISVTSVVEPAWTVAGTVMANDGGVPAAWQLVVHVCETPLYGLPE